MKTLLDLLPVATIAAISLFITKETFEFVRRMLERRRKKRAIKSLIRDELLSNHLAVVTLADAVFCSSDLEEHYEGASDAIVTGHGGRVFYRKLSKDGEVLRGSRIRQVKTTEYQRLLPQVAELDFKLYRLLRDGHSSIQELEHLVTSFIDHAGAVPDEQEWFEGFRVYALERLADISESVLNQYAKLGGNRAEVKVPAFLKAKKSTSEEA